MPEMPQAAPTPDRSPINLKGTHLAIASPASISETCFSIPAVRAIRNARSGSTIVVVANQETAPLWRKVTEVNHVLEHHADDSVRKIVSLLKDANLPFDSAIAWEDSPAAQAFAKFGIRQRVGYPSEKLAKFLTDPVKVIRKVGPIEHQVNHYLLFTEELGADPFQPSSFTNPPRPPAAGNFCIAIAPGSDYGTAAEWPLERFVALAQNISQRCEVAIIPSPGRPGPADSLAKALGNPALNINLEGDDLLEFLATCNGLVANDGTVAHMSSLVGTPSLVFFGPNEPRWKRPLGRIHRIVRRHVPCSGCLLNKCPLDHRCMIEITVEEALKELRMLYKAK
jgi:ADP-heptose:LPS heptosyltransferase